MNQQLIKNKYILFQNLKEPLKQSYGEKKHKNIKAFLKAMIKASKQFIRQSKKFKASRTSN